MQALIVALSVRIFHALVFAYALDGCLMQQSFFKIVCEDFHLELTD